MIFDNYQFIISFFSWLIYIQPPVIKQRYAIEMVHWCKLPDGSILYHSWSDNSLNPPLPDKMMISQIHYQAILIEPKGELGCKLTYIIKVIKIL
jgi:hypothetical protein